MTIKVGDKIPSVTLYRMTADGPDAVTTDELCSGKKVVLFGVPGAFTPTCSAQHVPGFLENAAAIKAKGVDTIACMSVNDAFVMGAWAKDQGTGEAIEMLADGSGDLTNKMGIELDLADRGLGVRARRFSMVLDDGVVTALNLEEGGALETSGAETLLEQL
ncbi:MAG: peroxiredoxin [Alphaproteobacteria bacterium]|nr:peroxiredoxin [Alphaproteobacteria bacterium]